MQGLGLARFGVDDEESTSNSVGCAVVDRSTLSLGSVKRDDSSTVLPAIAIAGQSFVRAVLNAKDTGERHGKPLLGERRGQSEIIGRISKRDVVRVRLECGGKAKRVRPM